MGDFIKDNGVQQIRVFSLNCWGIPFISKDRKNRIKAIADYLSKSNLDLVCLQEVWSKKDYLSISKKCYSSLPYSHYFNSFINGSGLCVLSKYSIIDVYFHQWAINGYCHKIHQGDWFAGKGLAFCRIKVNDIMVHLYNAHLHAEYNIHNTDYLSHRVLQAFDTSQFIKLTSEDCDLAILAGDLNTEPDDMAMKILVQNAHLVDCYFSAQETFENQSNDLMALNDSLFPENNSDWFLPLKTSCVFGTNESTRNSYAPEAELKRLPEGKRIDYILYRNSKRLNVDVLQYSFPLPERVPGCNHSYSDHEGIQAVINCSVDPTQNAKVPVVNNSDLQHTLETAIGICNEALLKLRHRQKTYITLAVVFSILVVFSLFAELFFHIPLDFGANHVASIVCFNIMKVFVTLAFTFFTLMATLWSKSEKSAVLTGKFSMMTILKRLEK